MSLLRAALLLAFCPCIVVAQDNALTSLLTGDDAAGWEAVGRIDIDGKGFCTGALIAPDLVLTAAHCLFDRESGNLVDPERFEFLAGLRNGRALAYRDVARAIAHPEYVLPGEGEAGGSANDVAFLVLTQPIRSTQVTPFDVLPDADAGIRVSVVSYAHDRAEAPALQAVCDRLGTQSGLYVLSCDVDYGSSGAPVFQIDGGVARIVSVISAKAEYEGERVAIASLLDAPLAALHAELARGSTGALSSVRVLTPGERNDTGARFVRP